MKELLKSQQVGLTLSTAILTTNILYLFLTRDLVQILLTIVVIGTTTYIAMTLRNNTPIIQGYMNAALLLTLAGSAVPILLGGTT